MTEPNQDSDRDPSDPAGTGGQASGPKADTPAAEQTKDKPDSGQNEDG